MTERLIHPEDYEPLPNVQLNAFITANGLSPNDVSAGQPLILEGGRLTVTEFLFEALPDGRRRKVLEPGGNSFVKRSVTVPLISPPEDHGL